jgi:hypothetical protein
MVDGSGEFYEVGRWHDMPNYECLQCPHKTLDRAEMQAHLAQRHQVLVVVLEPGQQPAAGDEEMPAGQDDAEIESEE